MAARGDAEQLIDFLQEDARESFKKVGRLDLMEGANKQIAEYYKRNSEDGGRAAAQRGQAQLSFENGEVYSALGKTQEAAKAFTEARELATQAVRRPHA